MLRSETSTAIQHLGVAFLHPAWWAAFLTGGRRALLSKMVVESIETLRQVKVPRTIEAIATLKMQSVLGRLGVTQEYLYYFVRALKPRIVVETGVFRGVSSAFILAALEDNGSGRLISIDLPNAVYPIPATTAQDASPLSSGEQTGFAIPEHLKSRWTLVLGDSRAELPKILREVKEIQLFYHDSEHTYETMSWEYKSVEPFLPPGSLLTSDDVNWNHAFNDFLKSSRVKWSCVLAGRFGVAKLC